MNNSKFAEYVALTGNPYIAIKDVVEDARAIALQNPVLLDSEALSWVLSGEEPQIISKYNKYVRRKLSQNSYISNILSEVDDEDVKAAVYESISASKRANYLVYVYTNISEIHRQARVRILVRMIWYNLHNYPDKQKGI